MMDISLAGLLGAIGGTIVAALVYVPLVEVIERWMKMHRSPGEQNEDEVALLRRAVLACDIFLLAGIGYWIGNQFAELVG
jgi:hypothetical protein